MRELGTIARDVRAPRRDKTARSTPHAARHAHGTGNVLCSCCDGAPARWPAKSARAARSADPCSVQPAQHAPVPVPPFIVGTYAHAGTACPSLACVCSEVSPRARAHMGRGPHSADEIWEKAKQARADAGRACDTPPARCAPSLRGGLP
ncbi:hypothetical protein CERSUDRAFT_92760 [Gelatoporia subvermispora B]|uniref:Uncharacterized protein n=1 Tax=Ceriporiopsis subvermispora (strain B) TaxID=914234 RepID=M2PQA2_CERS8|nr:hypothetical protein CERSUDRAFT_92760 [Gelatoporia subvermispora B]